jgi:FKBP-type peptidyl-prolyl cis-trans isomerase 2
MSDNVSPQIALGDTVTLHFSSADAQTGEMLEYTYDEEPKAYTIGVGEINPAFEKALIGCRADDEISVHLTAKEAYGAYHKKLIFRIRRKKIPMDTIPEPGTFIPLEMPTGGIAQVKIVSASNSTVVVDANHPFAGKDILYKIWICSVVPAESAKRDECYV